MAQSIIKAITGSTIPSAAISGSTTVDAALTTLNSNLQKLEDVEVHRNMTAGSITVNIYNGTGTIQQNVLSLLYNDKYMVLYGAYRLKSFVRTGANPGVNIILPYDFSSYSGLAISTTVPAGEIVTCARSAAKTLFISCTENFANYTSPYYVLYIPQMILYRQ